MTYGERLRELRAERRLSLRQVEERGGPNKDTMSLIERGVHKPHPRTLGRIADALEMSVPELSAELEEPKVVKGSADIQVDAETFKILEALASREISVAEAKARLDRVREPALL